jgi:hypothetical protein
LGIKFDGEHKEQFWKTIQYDISNNQEQKFEIRLRQIMEYEIRGEKFKWWNEASRRARKKRKKNFQSSLFQDRNEKLLCGSTSFLKTCKNQLKELLRGHYFNNCFTREMSELLFYIICNGSSIGGTGKSRYSEDQIKCKVKNELIREVLPEYWEIDEWLVFWVNFTHLL